MCVVCESFGVRPLRRAEKRRRNEAKDVGALDFCCCARIGHGALVVRVAWVEKKSAILKDPSAAGQRVDWVP